ncbi:MAG: hypothetical protein KA125_04965, partial [Chromatiaceae bacterium]|nr:hypothetical protein [Chromatiaceae bacterium]
PHPALSAVTPGEKFTGRALLDSRARLELLSHGDHTKSANMPPYTLGLSLPPMASVCRSCCPWPSTRT